MSSWTTLNSWLESPNRLFYLFGVITTISALSSVWLDFFAVALFPVAILVAYLAISNYLLLYQLLFFLIPFSVEIYLPGGYGTDLPSEPLMILISFIFILELIQKPSWLHKPFFSHPITILIMAHIGWTLVTAITAQNEIVSFKFLVAKIWYILAFYMMTYIIISKKIAFKKVIKWLLVGLLGAVIYVFIRHALVNFSFAQIHFIVGPFFRNHVTYGSLICILIPFCWFYWKTRKSWSGSIIWFFIGGFLILAMYLSFTRATYVAFLGAIAVYFIIRLRLTKWFILLSIIGSSIVAYNLLENNRYLDFAPDYNKTITHTEFESLIDATAKGEDISTMERVYRWIAGMNMIKEKFFVGFGPGNFYFAYKPYTESAFKTYVSDNPDKSGIHSYYLMIFVEQGILGLLIFLSLCILTLLVGEKAYHRLTEKEDKWMTMASLLCLIQILIILIINDLIESDKVGPFLFFSLAIIVFQDLKTRQLN